MIFYFFKLKKKKKGTKINLSRNIINLDNKSSVGEWDAEMLVDKKEFDPAKHEEYKLRILN